MPRLEGGVFTVLCKWCYCLWFPVTGQCEDSEEVLDSTHRGVSHVTAKSMLHVTKKKHSEHVFGLHVIHENVLRCMWVMNSVKFQSHDVYFFFSPPHLLNVMSEYSLHSFEFCFSKNSSSWTATKMDFQEWIEHTQCLDFLSNQMECLVGKWPMTSHWRYYDPIYIKLLTITRVKLLTITRVSVNAWLFRSVSGWSLS